MTRTYSNLVGLLIQVMFLLCPITNKATSLSQAIPQVNYQAAHVFYFWNPKNDLGNLDSEFLKRLVNIFEASIFVETGTATGKTSMQAASRFKEVHTIELSPPLYYQSCEYLKNQQHVRVYLGDSSEILPKLLPTLQGKIVFWLDGHYSGNITARGASNTPIIQELQAIKSSNITDAVILIDDIRHCQKMLKDPVNEAIEGYPTLQEIVQIILSINPDYKCMVLGDTLCAFIGNKNISPSVVTQACTISRLLTDENNEDLLHKAEHCIMGAEGREFQTIQEIGKMFMGEYPEYGIGRFYAFWWGLALLRNNPIQAMALFKAAIPATEPLNTRIQRYLA